MIDEKVRNGFKKQWKENQRLEHDEYLNSPLGQMETKYKEVKKLLAISEQKILQLEDEIRKLGAEIGIERDKTKRYRDRYAMLMSLLKPLVKEVNKLG